MAAVSADRRPAARVGLIGCGAIGSLLDEGRAAGQSLTHAAAIVACEGLELVAVADVDAARARACAAARGGPAVFDSVETLVDVAAPDILVLAAPPAGRVRAVEHALRRGVRHFVVEKPLAVSVAEASALCELFRDAGATCAVNYFRRWAPLLDWLRAELAALGGPAGLQSLRVAYGKGLANNASHLLDLLAAVVGQPVEAWPLPGESRAFGDDPTVDARLRFDLGGRDCWCTLEATDFAAFTVLEVDLLHERGRLRVLESGRRLEVQLPGDDPDYPGYRCLATVRTRDQGLDGAIDRLHARMAEAFRGGSDGPACPPGAGLAVLRTVDAILRAREIGQPVAIPRD